VINTITTSYWYYQDQKYTDDTKPPPVTDPVIGPDADGLFRTRNLKFKWLCTSLVLPLHLFFNLNSLLLIPSLLHTPTPSVAQKTQGPSPCCSVCIEDSIAVPPRKSISFGFCWIQASRKGIKTSYSLESRLQVGFHRSYFASCQPLPYTGAVPATPRRSQKDYALPSFGSFQI
jgi:hypothetical protein